MAPALYINPDRLVEHIDQLQAQQQQLSRLRDQLRQAMSVAPPDDEQVYRQLLARLEGVQNTLKSLANVLSLFREDFSAYSAATRANLEDIVWHAVHLFD